MCFYEKSKMAASSHGSRRFTAEEVLQEVFADIDSEFSDEESEDGFEYTDNGSGSEENDESGKEAEVSRKMTAEVIVETVKVRRKMQHLIEAKEEEGVVVVEKKVFVVEEEAVMVQQGVVVVEQEAFVVLDNDVANKLFNKWILKHSGFQWTESQMFLLSLALLG